MTVTAPRNFWYVAAFAEDIGYALTARTILNQPLVIFRTTAGQVAILEDRCPHRAVPLSLGTLIDDTIRCTYHGMQIKADGSCARIPCQDLIPGKARAATFPVVERDKLIWVWMGDADKGDASKVPDFHWFDDPSWTACRGYHHVGANYQLLNDNLLDLSHESYVHEDTIGNDAVAEAPVTSVVKDGKVYVSREINNCEAPPFYRKTTGFTSNINRWHTTIFEPPSFNVIENGSYPHDGSRSQALERRILNMVTPETDTSSHYFWGVARAFLHEDMALTEYIRQQIHLTFDQDKDLLEAQQRNLGSTTDAAFSIALRTDVGPIQARKLVKQLLENEAA